MAEEIGGEYEVCDVADRDAVWRMAAPSGNVTPSSACSSTTPALPGAATTSTCRRSGSRSSSAINYLGSVWCLLSLLPGAGSGCALAPRQRRLGRGHRRDRAVLGVEARAARVLAIGRERAAASRDPRAHGQPGLRAHGGFPAGLAAARPLRPGGRRAGASSPIESCAPSSATGPRSSSRAGTEPPRSRRRSRPAPSAASAPGALRATRRLLKRYPQPPPGGKPPARSASSESSHSVGNARSCTTSAHFVGSLDRSRSTSSSASSRVEIVPAARSSAISSSSRPISGPGGSAELVPAEQRLRRLGLARRRARRPRAPEPRRRRARRRPTAPSPGGTGGSSAVSRPRAARRAGASARTASSRSTPGTSAGSRRRPRRGETQAGRPARAIEPRARPFERRQQAELVGPPVALDREPDELRERTLPRGLCHERRLLAHEPFRLLLEHEAELVLEPHRAQQAQRIIREHGRRDGTDQLRSEVRAPAVRVDFLAAGQRDRDRVDREVASREVVLDPVVQGREVDGMPGLERDPPGAVALGQRKRVTARPLRVLPCGLPRLSAGDVEVDELPAQRLVPHRTAHDPRLFPGQNLLRELTHRAPPAGRASGLSRSATRART